MKTRFDVWCAYKGMTHPIYCLVCDGDSYAVQKNVSIELYKNYVSLGRGK